MTNFKLKAIPAALCAAGLLASGVTYAGFDGAPPAIAGVYAQGTFAPSAYMAISRGMYADDPTTSAATFTAGLLMLLLKPAQTAWGYALSTVSTGSSSSGTATLSHTLSTGTTTCTATYVSRWDSAGSLTLSVSTVAANPSTATSTCKTAFANQTGMTSDMFGPTGSTTSKVFNLIY